MVGTYPSPKLTLTLNSYFGKNDGRGRWAVSQKPNWSGRVTLLAESSFLHINILAHPVGSTWSRWDNQSMCEYCFRQSEHAWVLLAQALKGSTFFSYKMFAKVDSAKRVTLFPRKTCFWYNWDSVSILPFLSWQEKGWKLYCWYRHKSVSINWSTV